MDMNNMSTENMNETRRFSVNKTFFVIAGIAFFIVPWIFPRLGNYAPGAAILAGACCAFAFGNPFREVTAKAVSPLLGAAIVGMGFGMNLPAVLKAGASGFFYTVLGISAGLGIGILLGKKLKLGRDTMMLISVGTSICGGSAIAAAAPVLKAKAHDIALATATVFILNGVALLVFPPLGHWLGFNETQFGTWAALAIHDTSSVVGASMQYGETALEVGTTVKLARALWIVPVALFIAFLVRKDNQGGEGKTKVKVPWFIPGFLLAAMFVTWVPGVSDAGLFLQTLSKHLMVLTLFLIGANLSVDKIRELGIRPFLHGVILWVILATAWGAAIHFQLVRV